MDESSVNKNLNVNWVKYRAVINLWT